MRFEIAQRAWMAKVGKPMAAIDPRPYAEQVMSVILPQVKAGFPAVDQKRVKAKMGEGRGRGVVRAGDVEWIKSESKRKWAKAPDLAGHTASPAGSIPIRLRHYPASETAAGRHRAGLGGNSDFRNPALRWGAGIFVGVGRVIIRELGMYRRGL